MASLKNELKVAYLHLKFVAWYLAEIYFSNALKHKGVALKIIIMCDEGVVGRVNILNAEDYKPKLYKWNILVLQIN